MADISMLQILQGYLQVTNQRQQLIVSNMANVDTPELILKLRLRQHHALAIEVHVVAIRPFRQVGHLD